MCRALGLPLVARSGHPISTGSYLQRLDADEKRIVGRRDGMPEEIFLNQASRQTIISESGLYKVTIRASSAAAKPFQDWVTREVLPSIRQTGGYALAPGEAMPLPPEGPLVGALGQSLPPSATRLVGTLGTCAHVSRVRCTRSLLRSAGRA